MIHRRLLLVGLGLAASACQPTTTDLAVTLILPEDDTDLQRTNNVSVVLEPDGFAQTVEADGLDFSLTFEVPPDETTRTLAAYLAEDETLLAWGRTPPFTYRSAASGLGLLLARPGALTPLPLEFAEADAGALIAPVADVGALILTSDGGALFVDAYRYDLVVAAPLEAAPDPTDGVLVPAADGGVVRLVWRDELAAWRFDAASDAWVALELAGDLRGRPGAAAWVDPGGAAIRLYGGGQARDIVELALPGDAPRSVLSVDTVALDGPRPGAAATMLGPTALVVGGDDPTLPLVWTDPPTDPTGPLGAWTGLRCTAASDDATAVLCAGGSRDGSPTADLLHISDLDGAPTIETLPDPLPGPVGDALLFEDPDAVYAQTAAGWTRIDRSTLAVESLPSPSPRAAGGDIAHLATGATLAVGGTDSDGIPVDRWFVFAPDVTP